MISDLAWCRLLQLLNEVSSLSLRNVRVCVLDEADRLFEGIPIRGTLAMNFTTQIL